MKTRLFFIVCLLQLGFLKAQIITTVAGNGTWSYAGDGGQATAAELKTPSEVALDALGNIYIADYYNSRIRKVNSLGIITTIAGTGAAGFSGDSGQASVAKLNHPEQVAFDATGNMYIVDTDNNRIRKVSTLGIITTIAGTGAAGYSGDGGQATAAKIKLPEEIALDAFGNIYIADVGNNCIRKINSLGIITTIAGTGVQGFSGDGGPATAAQFYDAGVTVGVTGNIYIADFSNSRIRMINTAGIVNTIAGNGIGIFSGDGGLAINAEISHPWSIAIDYVGNLYFADYGNERVRMINPTGIISTIAGNGTGGFSGDGGIATNAELRNPNGVAIDASACNLYIADLSNNRIRKVSFSVVAKASADTICAGATTTLKASNATNYIWNTGAAIDSLVVSPATTTSYTITGINNSCVSKAVITINVKPSPSLSISGNSNICIGDNTTLVASGASNYVWSTGDTTASLFLKPVITTTYTTIGTIGTCSSIATVTVNINSAFDFVLPNIVTPNNDGVNDFIDFGKFQFSSLQLEIYNRWGTKVFESNNPTCVWKPTEDDGTYFYTLNYIINCNNEKQNKILKGFITVIR